MNPNELKKLPNWAIIIFTTRCAQRILPLWEKKTVIRNNEVKDVQEAMDFIEQYNKQNKNSSPSISDANHHIFHKIYKIISSASSLGNYNAEDFLEVNAANNYASECALRTIFYAGNIIIYDMQEKTISVNGTEVIEFALSAIEYAASSSVIKLQKSAEKRLEIIKNAKNIMNAAMRKDYEYLMQHSNEDLPIPTEKLGHLWPDGEPIGWPWKDAE